MSGDVEVYLAIEAWESGDRAPFQRLDSTGRREAIRRVHEAIVEPLEEMASWDVDL